MVLVLHWLARWWRGLCRDRLQPRCGGVVGGTGCDLILGRYWGWHWLIPRHWGVLREVRDKASSWGSGYCNTWKYISVYMYTTGLNLLATDGTKWLVSYKDTICLITLLSTSREVSFRALLLLWTNFWNSCAINAIKLIAQIAYSFNIY